MANDDVKIGITAEDAGVKAELAKIQASVSSATNEIKSKFASVTDVFTKVQGAFIAFTAVLAGGKAFKEAITETVNLTKSAQALGKQLGISATDASVLAVALDDVFVTQEQFQAGASKIAVNLKKNEEAFKNLGVATRDQNGNFRNQLDIQLDVNAALLKFKEGTDRNVEGVKIYGKSWAEVAPTLKVTRQAMEEAALKATALGLTVGQENVEATKRYRSAMNDVHDVVMALEKVIGDALLPVLSSLGEWFGKIGPSLVNAFRAAIYSIEAVFIRFKGIIVNWTDSIAGSIDIAGAYIGRFAAYAERALHLDFAGANAAWDAGTQHIAERMAFVKGVVADDAAAVEKSLQDALDRLAPGNQAPAKPTNIGTDTSDGGDDKLKNQMAAQEEAFAAFKANYAKQLSEQGNFQEFSKQMERDYWAAVLNTAKLSEENRLQIKRKVAELETGIAKQGYQEDLAAIKEQQAQYKNNLEQKLAIALEYQAKVTRAEGADSVAARAAGGEVLNIQRQINEQRLQAEQVTQEAMRNLALADIAERQAIAQNEVANFRLTNAQLIEQERKFAAERFQIEADALQKRLELAQNDPDRNVVEIARLNAQKLELERSYQSQVSQLNLRSSNEATRGWRSAFSSMQSGFTSVLQQFGRGTLTFSGLVKGMFTSVLDAVTNTLAQMAAQWLTTTIAQMFQSKAAGSSVIATHAAEAGAAATAATAAIPFVGPALAPAAGALAYSEAMAFQAGLAAEQGFDVPAGLNPVTQLHQREMVLPAKYADTIRNLSEGSGGGHSQTNHFHISALDGASVKKILMDQKSAIAAALKSHMKGTGRLVPSY